MDNRINQIRKQIRALRVSMLEAEAVMREQMRHCHAVEAAGSYSECADLAHGNISSMAD